MNSQEIEDRLERFLKAIEELPGKVCLGSNIEKDIRKKEGSKSTLKERFRPIIEAKFRKKYPFF